MWMETIMSDYLKSNLNLGNIITIILVVCGVVASWTRMDGLIEHQDEALIENKSAIKANAVSIQQLQTDFTKKLADREGALREEIDRRNEQLRTTLARTDAKLEVLSRELGEIKSSLRSMETNIAWIVRQDKRSQIK